VDLFNLLVNFLGAFVHPLRLQYVEFFGKFYEDGGELFAPLTLETRKTMIDKE
jgi:V/A-type H+-transporting ATPase subunit I